MIAQELEEPEEIDELLDSAVQEDWRDEYSWPSFVQAMNIGCGELKKNKKKFRSGRNPDYAVIDVRSWRAQGVLPIPFNGKEEFVGYDFTSTEETSDESEM